MMLYFLFLSFCLSFFLSFCLLIVDCITHDIFAMAQSNEWKNGKMRRPLFPLRCEIGTKLTWNDSATSRIGCPPSAPSIVLILRFHCPSHYYYYHYYLIIIIIIIIIIIMVYYSLYFYVCVCLFAAAAAAVVVDGGNGLKRLNSLRSLCSWDWRF